MKVLACMFFFFYLPICNINLFVYLTRWMLKSLSIMQWIIFCLAFTSKWFLTYSIIFLYFFRLNNSYCAENLNIVLDHVITVSFVFVCFTPWFLKMSLFPYPYGFCNPVQINRKKNKWWCTVLWMSNSHFILRSSHIQF